MFEATCVLICLGIFLFSLLITTFIFSSTMNTRRFRTVPSFLIANLCFTRFLFEIMTTSPMLSVFSAIHSRHAAWVATHFFLKFMEHFSYVTLVAISAYSSAAVPPQNYGRISRYKSVVMVTVVWFLSIFLMIFHYSTVLSKNRLPK